MKIVLLEFIDEFELFNKYLNDNNLKLEYFEIVAIEPRLQTHLKKLGISYRDTLEYFGNESHKRIVVEVEKIMKYIRDNFKFTDKNGVRNSYQIEFATYMKIYLNHLLKMIEIINNIYIEKNKCVFFANADHGITTSLLIGNNERYIGILAKLFSERKRTKFVNLNLKTSFRQYKVSRKKQCKTVQRVLMKALLIFLYTKKIIYIPRISKFGKLASQISKRDKKIVFLAINYTGSLLKPLIFNLLSILKSALNKDYCKNYIINPNFINRSIEKDDQLNLIQNIENITDINNKQLFNYRGVDYYELIKEKVDTSFKGHLVDMLSYSYNLKHLFKWFNNKMVMSYSGLGIMTIAGELSKRMGMRSLFVSHGASPVPVDSYHEIELYNICKGFMLGDYTHIALSTPVQEDHLHYFKKKYREPENFEIKTGPLIFASLNGINKTAYKAKFGIPHDNTVVIYATTNKERGTERFYFMETNDQFFSSLSDIINSINKMEKTTLIIRLHPGYSLTDNEIKILLPESNNYIIHREGSFLDALALSDLLISYSSTTMDEALINKVPVIVFDKWNQYNHYKLEPFKDKYSSDIFPVCYVNNSANIRNAIQFMINRIKTTKKEDIDVEEYCYSKDYSESFYSFIEEALQQEQDTI